MRDQLHRIEANIQNNVRQICSGLVEDIGRELWTLQEHASKLEEYELQSREDRQGCTLQEHTSKLEDYKDLQNQHRLTLETCDSLRKQNIRLQNQVKDLLAERFVSTPKETPKVTPRPEKGALWKYGVNNVSPNVQKLVEDHPDLQAAMTSQVKDYKKLQKAHGILLGKLKEHQKIIEQLRDPDPSSDAERQANNARLAHLRDIIGGNGRSSKSPAFSASGSPSSPTNPNKPIVTAGISRVPGSDQIEGPENVIVIQSSLPDGSGGSNEAETPAPPPPPPPPTTTTTTTEAIAQPSHDATSIPQLAVSESEPEFISERPVKKRRMGPQRSDVSTDRPVKTEPMTSDRYAHEERQASIDLDAVFTPILLREKRAAVERPRSPNAISAMETGNTQRHSEPPPNSIHLPATDFTSVNKSVSFTSDRHEIRYGNVDGQFGDLPASRPRDQAVHFQGRPLRSVLQPTDSNSPTHNRSEEPVVIDDVSSKGANRPVVEERENPKRGNRSAKVANSAINPTFKKKLREKTIEELTVSDFRLNPSMTLGFNQTMGNTPLMKSRNCSSDCSKPECCGSAFATAIRKAGIASIDELSVSSKDQVISRYLGFPVSRLGSLSHSAYQKLLGEAIGKQFAEKYGKQQSVRADSPPGYWRVEFPTTQDRMADERKANELEKAVIKQRRREALREGGLWRFRDE